MGCKQSKEQERFMRVLELNAIEKWIGLWAKRVSMWSRSQFTFEDAQQELIVRAYERFKKYYDQQKGPLEGFVSTVVSQEGDAIMTYQGAEKRSLYEQINPENPSTLVDDRSEYEEAKLWIIFIECDLERLGMNEEIRIIRFLLDGYNVRETATRIGISRETVRRKLRRIEKVYG